MNYLLFVSLGKFIDVCLVLVLVLQTAFRLLVGKGYQTLQSLLLDFCQWKPNETLLNGLLDMLVDGKFDIKVSPIIKVMSSLSYP